MVLEGRRSRTVGCLHPGEAVAVRRHHLEELRGDEEQGGVVLEVTLLAGDREHRAINQPTQHREINCKPLPIRDLG